MSGKTKIEWTDRSWNPVRGCSRVSAGCENCYAERVAHRFNGLGQPYEGLTRMVNGRPTWNGKITLAEHLLAAPLKWRKPSRIFVNSMSDLFHSGVPDGYIHRVFAIMALCPQHQFQVLTKRPERMKKLLSRHDAPLFIWREMNSIMNAPQITALTGWHSAAGMKWPLPNVWMGVSVEDQATAEQRIPHLLETPADVRWVSAEPLLGPVDLESVCVRRDKSGEEYQNCLSLEEWSDFPSSEQVRNSVGGGALIDWVVAGGESGPGSRPAHPDWFRSLRDQCARSGTRFFFKQQGDWSWGDFIPKPNSAPPHKCGWVKHDGRWTTFDAADAIDFCEAPGRAHVINVGKSRAGRLLDGREHNEYPEHAQ